MKEADLVIGTILEVLNREHNGSIILRLGSVLADPAKFKMIFDLMTKNTQLDHTTLDILTTQSLIKCECGYEGEGITHKGMINARCPICNRNAKLTSGLEFQILEPKK